MTDEIEGKLHERSNGFTSGKFIRQFSQIFFAILRRLCAKWFYPRINTDQNSAPVAAGNNDRGQGRGTDFSILDVLNAGT